MRFEALSGMQPNMTDMMTRLKISEILKEGASLEIREANFAKHPEIAQLFQETKDRKES